MRAGAFQGELRAPDRIARGFPGRHHHGDPVDLVRDRHGIDHVAVGREYPRGIDEYDVVVAARLFQEVFGKLLIPAVFVIIVVVAFQFLGDGLRDAADPYR